MTERTVAEMRGDIDAAWARAEDRLGDYWRIRSLTEVGHEWEAVATDGRRIHIGVGSSPVTALDALSYEVIVNGPDR